jgi:hypothetical protein
MWHWRELNDSSRSEIDWSFVEVRGASKTWTIELLTSFCTMDSSSP